MSIASLVAAIDGVSRSGRKMGRADSSWPFAPGDLMALPPCMLAGESKRRASSNVSDLKSRLLALRRFIEAYARERYVMSVYSLDEHRSDAGRGRC